MKTDHAIRWQLLILVAVLLLAPPARSRGDAVFQYTVAAATKKGESPAYLWVPPKAQQVRGVIVAGMTLIERELARDPKIREACAAEGLAIVYLKCGLSAVDLQKVLDDLAAVSGYREISHAPLMFVGHSAGGPQAKALAIRLAERCFGVMQYRGGIPGTGSGGKEEVVPVGVPALMMIGQFDEFGGMMRNSEGRESWQGGRDQMAAYRAADERNLGCIVVEPGAGHFAWTARNAEYLALWIRKAAAARIPASWPADATAPVKCLAVDHAKGWLSDIAITAPTPAEPAPHAKYAGDRAKTNWHFDEELARATVAYHRPAVGGFGKKDQFIKWKDEFWVDAGVRHFFNRIDWVGDGQTFEVHPAFAEAYPVTQPPSPRWAQAGQPLGHAAAPIGVLPVSGPIVATGPATFRIAFDCLSTPADGTRVTFLAFHPGDNEYRHAEIVGMLPRGFNGLKDGKEQKITFPPIGALKAGGAVALKATSDAGLPVDYLVAYGPARIEGNRLVAADVPARAKGPIEVKVIAWQFGRGVAPQVRTAEPVEQVIKLEP